MRATVFRGKGDVRVEQVPDPIIQQSTDAIVRVTHACICGSDLWFYRGQEDWQPGWRTGHEWMGIVEEVGRDVQSVKKGDWVIAPFMYSDGSCEFCHKGLTSACSHGGFWGGASMDGGQGEAVRAPFADATLVKLPEAMSNDETLLRSVLPLTDVLPTGHHAAICAGVTSGSVVAIVGDGAVGLCGVLAARRLGASRILMLGHQAERLKLAQQFGATDLISARGEEAIEQVQELTQGGAIAVLECVGSTESLKTAIAITRAGGQIGYVGVPHHAEPLDMQPMFLKNIGLRGGVAPVRAYLPELLSDTLAGRIDASPVLDRTVDLNDVPAGYAAMDGRQATKVMVRM
jgi:threonine dehydrogenase-like Zn-dependent dehydrogenase